MAAVDDDAGAGDEVGALGGEEGDEIADGLGPAEPAEGEVAGDEVCDDFGGVVALGSAPMSLRGGRWSRGRCC